MRTSGLYASVTVSIVKELEAGATPWLKPWRNGRSTGLMPENYATRRPYSGINIMLLWAAREARGYERNAWLTYKQAAERKANVRKGEKATTVVFTKRLSLKKEDNEDERQISILRTYSVFKVAQVEGLPVEKSPPQRIMLPIDAAARFIEATKADIRLGGNAACYVPSHDVINMPLPDLFKSQQSFYATNLYELGHWSGAPHRLDRDLAGRFGSKRYAAEELIAELTAAFLCANLEIEGELRHAGYIRDWVTLLNEDDRAIFAAASKASQAADFLRSLSQKAEPAPP